MVKTILNKPNCKLTLGNFQNKIRVLFGAFMLLSILTTYAQATVTIEVNWPNWSSENRVTLNDPTSTQVGQICDPTNCFNGFANSAYATSVNYNVPYGTGYTIVLEDTFGDGWNGAGSYVRVFVDGVLTLENDGKEVFVNGVYFDQLTRTLAFDVLTSPTVFNGNLSVFDEFAGYIDYTSTGNTLRTNDNVTNACSITTTSSGTLTTSIPIGATIEKAYLYWVSSGINIDTQVTLDAQTVNAGSTFRSYLNSNQGYFTGAIADVTTIVDSSLDETFDFAGLTIDNSLQYCTNSTVLGGWSLVVFYSEASLPASNIVLYNGFTGQSGSGTNFSLSGFFANGISGSKATFLSWEGDPNISGTSGGFSEQLQFNGNVLSGDGTNTGSNAYNSTNYDELATVPNPVETFYGLDLDTFDASPYITTGDTSATARVEVGQDFVITNVVIIKVPSNLISGFVFEDTDYGGGLGRSMAASSGAPVVGATIELYDNTGTLLQTTTTDSTGEYLFGGMINGTFSVRVVNSTVNSTRTGGSTCATCIPIQTFRTDFSSSTISNVANEVGGANPSGQDVAVATLTGAQSIATVTLANEGAVGINFGFNFNTIVNTNATDQGSLAQFIENSNNLGDTGLNIEANSIFDPATGEDTSVFMIPTSDPNFSGGIFTITQPTQLPAITDTNTFIDGRTQTANIGDTNTGTVIGINEPEIQIDGASSGDVFRIQADDTTIRNLAIYGNGNEGISVESGSISNPAIITENYIGANADGNFVTALEDGIEVTSAGVGQISNNYITQNSDNGIELLGSNSSVSSNTITNNGDVGVVVSGGTTSGNLISQNSIYANGTSGDALGIDISDNGVSINDSGDGDAGPNGTINFPVFDGSPIIQGGNLILRGWSRPGATIEFFISDISEGSAVRGDNQIGQTQDYGEGQTYLTTLVEGSGSDLSGATSSYTDPDGNTDNTNYFEFSIPLPGGASLGTIITSTATISNSTSEFSPNTFIDADNDNDGIADVTDEDDDNDGILDTAESNGVDPSADFDNDGTPNYLDPDYCTLNGFGICTSLDPDNDGIPNHFDLDSDGDGCLDVDERYIGVVSNPDPDNDGIYGTGTPTVTATGRVTTAGYNDTNLTFLSAAINSCDDNDADGVPDVADLDDDNDGILDTDECEFEEFGTTGFITSATFNTTGSSGGPIILNSITVSGTTYTEFKFPDSYTSNFASQGMTASDAENIQHGNSLNDYVTTSDWNNQILQAFQSNDINWMQDLNGAGLAGTTAYWQLHYSTPIYVNGENIIWLSERHINNGYILEAYDISGTLIGTQTVNVSDLINSGIQANHTPTNTGTLGIALLPLDQLAPLGSNVASIRVYDNASSNDAGDGKLIIVGSDASSFTVCNTDTDGDGDINIFDLDSDGDGCDDVIEAGFTDQNGDGILGDLATVVNSDGQVIDTNVVDGYTTPADNDSSGTPDFLEAGSAPTISNPQPADVTVCVGDNTSFTVNASGSNLTYQWQVDTGGGFTDLSNGGVYSNVNAATLNITGVTEAMSGYQYQVIVTNSAFACNNATSAPATLTVPDVTYTISRSNPATCGGLGSITLSGLTTGETYTINYLDDGAPVVVNIAAVSGQVVISNLDAGNYTSIIPSLSGCSGTASNIVLSDPANPTAPTSGGNETYCEGSTVSTITASVSSGETVDWYSAPSGGTLLLSGNTSFTPSSAGTYYAEARNTTTGCISTTRTAVTVTEQAAPDAGTDGNLTLCTGDTATLAQLNAAITGEDAGGVWSPAFAPGVTTYTYTVAATGACTVDDTSTVSVTYDALPNAGTDGNLTLCTGDTATLAQLNAAITGEDAGGVWSPAFAPGVTTYTYTVASDRSMYCR